MLLTLLQVNFRADLTRRALRYEILGKDGDDRLYFVLSLRPVEENGRPPMAWASGLLVWGKGVVSSSNLDNEPNRIERWSHFGKSAAVRQLAKWTAWNNKKAVAAARSKSTKAQRTKVEVIIPPYRRSGSSSSSALSSLSDDDLLDSLDPEGFSPSAAMIDESGKDLVRRLHEVAEWLEVLEAQGMAEVH